MLLCPRPKHNKYKVHRPQICHNNCKTAGVLPPRAPSSTRTNEYKQSTKLANTRVNTRPTNNRTTRRKTGGPGQSSRPKLNINMFQCSRPGACFPPDPTRPDPTRVQACRRFLAYERAPNDQVTQARSQPSSTNSHPS